MSSLSVESYLLMYAAIVSTGALFLQVRRWFEADAKLHISVLERARMPGEKGEYVVVTVVNRGGAPTTVSLLAFHVYKNRFWQFLLRPTETLLVPLPLAPGGQNLPVFLPPGERWVGLATRDEEMRKKFENNHIQVNVYTDHRSRPTTRLVRPSKRKQ